MSNLIVSFIGIWDTYKIFSPDSAVNLKLFSMTDMLYFHINFRLVPKREVGEPDFKKNYSCINLSCIKNLNNRHFKSFEY